MTPEMLESITSTIALIAFFILAGYIVHLLLKDKS